MQVYLSHTLFISPPQEENEEMGRELSEDRVHKLERQLALAKAYAEDMQAAFQECEDHATALDEEAEKIQEEVCSFKTPLLFQLCIRSLSCQSSIVLKSCTCVIKRRGPMC